MLWGAIGHNQVLGPVIFQGLGPGRSNGITAQRYVDQVLHPHVLPFFQAHGNWVFQHDNARPHTARATQDLLQRSGIQARLQWAQGHLNWNNVRWQNVLFSDESRFCIDHADGRVRVWRRRGDRYADNCVVENNAWGGPSLMLWGAIGHNQVLGPVIFQGLGPGRSNGITAQRYMDQVLRPHVLPFFQAHGNWARCL
nr:hypothetical protein BaRGS_027814 [Batillaria attramentaria]